MKLSVEARENFVKNFLTLLVSLWLAGVAFLLNDHILLKRCNFRLNINKPPDQCISKQEET